MNAGIIKHAKFTVRTQQDGSAAIVDFFITNVYDETLEYDAKMNVCYINYNKMCKYETEKIVSEVVECLTQYIPTGTVAGCIEISAGE